MQSMIRPFRFALTFLFLYTIGLSQSVQPPLQPDPRLTPGDVLDVTTRDICVVGYTTKVRNVPESVKRRAYAMYGIQTHRPGEYEVDHLISLELGGSNAIANLWPQSYLTSPYNARIKDALENKLHRLVCAGQLDLRTAQREIATDWIGAYHRYVLGQSQDLLANNRGRTNSRTVRTSPTYQSPPQQPDYGNAPTYSRSTGKAGARRGDQQDSVDVAQEEPPPYHRVPAQSRRRQQSKRCKLKNLWCGFGLLR